MALGLDVATLARAWTSLDFARKPPSGDGSYDGFNLKQVPLGVSPGYFQPAGQPGLAPKRLTETVARQFLSRVDIGVAALD
jgi:hypothetical protein